jgi:hypothetical protein
MEILLVSRSMVSSILPWGDPVQEMRSFTRARRFFHGTGCLPQSQEMGQEGSEGKDTKRSAAAESATVIGQRRAVGGQSPHAQKRQGRLP